MSLDYAKKGYRIVSRKYGTVSRIDREDWKEFMAKEHAPWDIEEGRKWVELMGDIHAADHYRRVYSKDTIDLGREALTLKIPNSGDSMMFDEDTTDEPVSVSEPQDEKDYGNE